MKTSNFASKTDPTAGLSPCQRLIAVSTVAVGRHILLALLFLLVFSPLEAKIWRVNNTAGVARDFATINEAVATADPNDTIHIEGSVTPYDEAVLVSDPFYIFGPGFDLTVNPETQHIKQSAKVKSISFLPGSEGSVLAGIEQIEHTAQMTLTRNAGGTTMGINNNFPGPGAAASPVAWAGPVLTIKASNIKVINCKLNYVLIDNSAALSNIDIRKCWFCPGVVLSTSNATVTNLNLINNFFRNDGSGSTYRVIDLHAAVKANIGNNTFYGGFKINALENCRITNNVFYLITGRAATNLTTSVSNVYIGNISNIDLLGGIVNGQNGNTIRATETTEALSNVWFAATGGIAAVDKYFPAINNASSPIRQAAIFAGTTGELGMFGGLSPFSLSGLTNIPAVYEIQMPAEVSSDGFNVTVKVKAH